MRLSLLGLATFIAAAPIVGCDGSGNSDAPLLTETFQWNGQVAPDALVEVRGIGGSVTFVLGSGDDISVEAVKSSHSDDPSTVTIDIVEHAGDVRICAVYPDVPGRPPNSCAPGGNLSSQGNNVRVHFTIRVPPGRRLDARMIGGDMTAVGMENDVFMSTQGGTVVISTTDIAEASTVGGNITVTIGSTTLARNLMFVSISGNITVTVPPTINAEVYLRTVTGTVDSDDDFGLTEVSSTHHMGTLGTGGASLTLNSLSGNVRLLQGS